MRRRHTGAIGEVQRQNVPANPASAGAPGGCEDRRSSRRDVDQYRSCPVGPDDDRRRRWASSSPATTHGGNPTLAGDNFTLNSLPASAASSSVVDENTVGLVCTMYLPAFFDTLSKYQYHQALAPIAHGARYDWKHWEAFVVMMKLTASCESTYHLMTYLEPRNAASETIDEMYNKVVMLMQHLANEIRPLSKQQEQQHAKHQQEQRESMTDVQSRTSELSTKSDIGDGSLMFASFGDLPYYVDLLDQAATFLSLRIPMLQLYRSLLQKSTPLDFHAMKKKLDTRIQAVEKIDHPLLDVLKESAIQELQTVRAALHSEMQIAQYNMTTSIIALHKLKAALTSWSDHIDSLSDYPLFDGFGGPAIEEGSFERSQDETDVTPTQEEKVSSRQNDSNDSSLSSASVSAFDESDTPNLFASDSQPPSSSFNERRKSLQTSGSIEWKQEEWMEKYTSAIHVTSGTSSETKDGLDTTAFLSDGLPFCCDSALSKLKRQLSLSNLPVPRFLMQQSDESSRNNLRHSTLTSSHSGSAETPHVALPTGVHGTGMSLHQGQEEHTGMETEASEEGFALPVFQWSQRFYRSLLAKFSLYFHQWLEPFEKRGKFLSSDLTHFIKTPSGLAYLQLMDALLGQTTGQQKSNTNEEGSAHVMILLDTAQLDDQGGHYYVNGYRCPSSSSVGGQPLYIPPTESTSESDEDEPEDGRFGDERQAKGIRAGPGPGRSRFRPKDENVDHQDDFAPLWGVGAFPAVFRYPTNVQAPREHWPNVVSLIMEHKESMETTRPVFTHSEKRMKAVYYMTRVDPCLYLVLLMEGKSKVTEKAAQDFMQLVTTNLQHSPAFELPRAPPSSV